MQAEIIFTGNKLLLGEILNTNAQYLGRELFELGIEVLLHTTVGDNRTMLQSVLHNSFSRVDLLIITGGLGPAADDLIKETVADFWGLDMVLDEQTLRRIEKILAERGVTLTENLRKQALIPRGALVLSNPAGIAPGLLIRKEDKTVILLPGSPGELRAVFEGSAKKHLEAVAGGGIIMHSKVFKVTGISESQVQKKLNGGNSWDNPSISYVAIPGEVHVRITARADSERKARELLNQHSVLVEDKLEDYIFGRDNEVLEEVVGRLLVERGMTVSLAESCTGGQVMKRLSDIAGSSRYLLGGVVAYSNEVKISLLGVPRETINRYGAVSEQTARSMAEGVRKLTGSSLGIGITGIAGPDGGTPEKPVGLVYIALADKDNVFCRGYRFPGQRRGVRSGAANASLNMLRRYVLGI
ncbi:competence/damage-inducible protein A [Desulfallas sp. Bu1-1]|uniref:competence/damage-inducible protein A n=1 Tax=Desulfallas sp. Bu1-1 TaxID=2787620 RepID=UPI0018A01143|nr:competence/damage-inducible protein A [Desulfallas sp. Bu1-1]MBF7083044.1 competence/damage-inducible protein A [Desulfallas sp. Bu1-1]